MASPTWYAAIPPRSWGTLPNSNLSASGVMAVNGDLVVSKWGGGIICTGGLYIGAVFTSGTFLVIWGGGHTDYSGNEVYAYGPLENNSPTWNRLRDATSPAPQDVSTDGSGNPVSRHTYNAIVYVNDGGSKNWLVAIGALFSYVSANSYSDTYVYNFNQVSPNSNQPWSLKTASGDADVAAYDSVLNRIWYHKNAINHVGYYDVAANTVSDALYKSPVGYGSNAHSCIDTVRGIWALWDASSGLSFYRTNNGTANDYYVPTQTGPIPANGNGSIIYDAANDVLRLWLGGGRAIYTLSPPPANPYSGGAAWTWSLETPQFGSTPDAQTVNSTFGRFAHVNSVDIRGHILLNSATGSINFFNGSKAAPRPNFSQFPKSILRR